MAKCGAKTRNGGKCKRNAMANGRCNLHGGKSTGPPKGSQNALKFGFFAKIMPNDAETLGIVQDILTKEPIDIVWENIVIQYTAILRAQKIMFVRDQDDIVEKLKRQKGEQLTNSQGEIIGDVVTEREWEFQYPWDRHASFMTAQSRAMSELRSLIKDFLEIADESDMRRKKLEVMQKDIELKNLEIQKLREGTGTDDDGINVVVDYGDDNA